MRRLSVITTGGTIEKEYDEASGDLVNRTSHVRRMLAELRLEDTDVAVVELMHKDSLDLTDTDRAAVLASVEAALAGSHGDGVVVLHGTDTLATTGELLAARIPRPGAPVVLTGALRPFAMKRSDALQNLTEAIFATGVLPPGVYVVAHGRALAFPGAHKDRDSGTFVASS